MPYLEMLEVATGLILVYLVLSLIATSMSEVITQYRGLRGRTLREAVEVLLGEDRLPNPDDKKITQALYDDPAIKTLAKAEDELPAKVASTLSDFWKGLRQTPGRSMSIGNESTRPERRDPSYIPADVFAKALVDVVTADQCRRTASIPCLLREQLEAFGKEPADVIPEADKAAGRFVSKTLVRHLDEAGGDYDGLLKQIRISYENTSQRTSGWFKRRLSRQLLLIGFVIAVFANADTIQIFKQLQQDPNLRQTAIELAKEQLAKAPENAPENPAETEQAADEGQTPSLTDEIKQNVGTMHEGPC